VVFFVLKSMRKCPFCKKNIKTSDTLCPYCKRVLVEIIKDLSSRNNTLQHHKLSLQKKSKKILINFKSKLKNIVNTIKNKFKRKKQTYTYQFDKWKKYKKNIVILLAILIVFLIINSNDNSKSDKSDLMIPSSTSIQTKTIELNPKPLREYNSLPNGTIISSTSLYSDGLGELKIDNGTDMDALAKLVESHSCKSVYTVYIKANNIYTMTGVSDGYYDLYFAHGQDWDEVGQEFLVNASYSKFEDNFNFITEKEYLSDSINTRYTIFEVTLHSVFDGSAETDKVSESEFNEL